MVVVDPLNLELLNQSGGKLNGLNGAPVLSVATRSRREAVERFELFEQHLNVGRTETERKPYQYRVTLRYVERTQQNPYGLLVSSMEQTELLAPSQRNAH